MLNVLCAIVLYDNATSAFLFESEFLTVCLLSQNLVVPSVKTLGLSLSVPYIASHGLAPLLISSPGLLVTFQRRIYPLLLLATGLVAFFTVQARQFKKLLEHIKNDR